MNEPDSKKLIAGFLVLATITSSAVFALSGYLTTRANKNGPETASLLKNAFSKNKPANLSQAPGENPEKNLTNDLATSIALEILKGNQNLSQTEVNQGILNIPTNIDGLLDKYVSSVQVTDAMFSIDESRIKIKKNASDEDIIKYFEFLGPILEEMGSGLEGLAKKLNSSQDPKLVGALDLLYSETQQKLLDLETPEAALGFHRSILYALSVPTKIFNESSAKQDPIKTVVALNLGKEVLDERLAEMTKEFNLLEIQLKTVSNVPESQLEWIKTAHAVIPVSDWYNWVVATLNNISNWATYYLEYGEWYQKILMMQIRDRLLKQVIDAILNWVGMGDSMVGDWQTYLKNTFAAAANQYINQAAQGFCTNYRNNLTEQLQKSTGAKSFLERIVAEEGFNTGCPLESIVSDIDLFYNDFSAGGWDAYAALTLPSSNYYGSSFFAQEAITNAALEKKGAEESRLVGGAGYAGTSICEDGTSPKSGVCGDGSTQEITTPGRQQSDLASAGLSSSLRRIENADASDWTVLLNAFINSALNKLLASGNKGVRNGNVTGSGKGDPYAVCNNFPRGSKDYLDCINNVNAVQNPPGSDALSIRNTLISEAEEAMTKSSDTLNTVLVSIDTVSSTIAILNEVLISCPAEASSAQIEINILNEDFATLVGKADEITSRISFLELLLEEVESHEPQDDTDYFTEKYAELQSYADKGKIANEEARVNGDLGNFKDKLETATNLLTQCTAQ